MTKDPKTAKSKRQITIPENLNKILKGYKVWWDNQKNELAEFWKNNDRLFVQWNGQALYPSSIRFWLKKTLQQADLPDVCIHSLRHTNITLQLQAGVPIHIVSNRAGHAKPSVTYDVYCHYIKGDDVKSVDALNNIFKKV